MRRKIGRLIIGLGIIILMIPAIGSIYTYYQGKKLYQDYLQNLEQVNLPEIIEKIPDRQADVLQIGTAGEREDVLLEESEQEAINSSQASIEVIGRIKIPIIKVNLLLVEGVSKKALGLGAGHMKGTALPGEIGNCAIAGHRNYTFGQIFNRLNEVKREDEIIVEVGEESYIYKVKDIEIVEPEDVSILRQFVDKKEVTLITCHPVYLATHRLVITGELVE